MANVIIGHSQVKYFENYLNIPDTKCDHFSGCLIEHLLQESSVKTLISKSQVVAVLCGINNIPKDEPKTVLQKFQKLHDGIMEINPNAKVILSTILPRDKNLRPTGPQYTEEELLSINRNIGLINEKLQIISSRVPGLYVVEHPQFLTDDDFINDSLLAADGLHLNFEGTPIAVSNIESAILEVRRDLLKAEFDMLQQLETSMLDENVDAVIQGEEASQHPKRSSHIRTFSDTEKKDRNQC